MIWSHIITQAVIYSLITDGYLFALMIFTSPRIWAYTDYPEEIRNKIPPQTKAERLLSFILAIPWMLFTFTFPIYSVLLLKYNLGNSIPFWAAFANLFTLLLFANIIDLVILDWAIVSKITPKFVIMPGTEKADYKSFTKHYLGHAKSAIIQTILCIVVAAIICLI